MAAMQASARRRSGLWAQAGGLSLAALLVAGPARAAESLHGAGLSIVWAVPFAALLLSIALGPIAVPNVWHNHYGKLAAVWALVVGGALVVSDGPKVTGAVVMDVLLHEYVPFVLMLFALFTTAGGILVRFRFHRSPQANAALLVLGTALASVIGTTGASMILARPLIRANHGRHFGRHVLVFFIFLVSNIGGALSPLGDPPLFLGFLRGIDFFWPLRRLWPETLFAAGVLLVLFLAIDIRQMRREQPAPERPDTPLSISGSINIVLIGIAVGAIVTSGVWRPGIAVEVLGTRLELQNIVREAVMLAVGIASLRLTPHGVRAANDFSWSPLLEVVKLFAAIFVCLIPVMAMLQAGRHGVFAPLVALTTHADGTPNPLAYFWSTGLLSSVLDNAPTYLVFYELTGGDPAALTGPLSGTLAAISLGAVFMGAMTYIGNAPNLMVYAIARHSGMRMPGFFGYMAWSGAILLPLFATLSLVFLR
jgi:Na+/H+ antiporter NhaD/arsenite permease-like protein